MRTRPRSCFTSSLPGQDKSSRRVANRNKAMVRIEALRRFVLGVNDQRVNGDFAAAGALYRIPPQGASEFTAMIGARDGRRPSRRRVPRDSVADVRRAGLAPGLGGPQPRPMCRTRQSDLSFLIRPTSTWPTVCPKRNRQNWKWGYNGIGVGSGPSGSSLTINPSAFVAARKLQQALATIIAQLERSR